MNPRFFMVPTNYFAAVFLVRVVFRTGFVCENSKPILPSFPKTN